MSKEKQQQIQYLLSDSWAFSGWTACNADGGGGSSIDASVACIACSMAEEGLDCLLADGVGEAVASEVFVVPDASPPPLKVYKFEPPRGKTNNVVFESKKGWKFWI